MQGKGTVGKRAGVVPIILILLAGLAAATVTVQISFPQASGLAPASKTFPDSCGYASACFSQVAAVSGQSYALNDPTQCHGLTQEVFIDTVDGVYANSSWGPSSLYEPYWEFDVNGASASVGTDCYQVEDGDTIALDYLGNYLGPVMPQPAANSGSAGGYGWGNACIDARYLGWTGALWPQVCGNESDWLDIPSLIGSPANKSALNSSNYTKTNRTAQLVIVAAGNLTFFNSSGAASATSSSSTTTSTTATSTTSSTSTTTTAVRKTSTTSNAVKIETGGASPLTGYFLAGGNWVAKIWGRLFGWIR